MKKLKNKHGGQQGQHPAEVDGLAAENPDDDAEEQVDLKKKVGMKVDVNLKGLGFTFIDNHPKELMFIQLCGLDINYSSISQAQLLTDGENASESTITNTHCKLTLGNF